MIKKNIFLEDTIMLNNFYKSRILIGNILDIMNMNSNDRIFDKSFEKSLNRDLQLLNVLFNMPTMNAHKHYEILLRAIDYYGKSEYITSLDYKGTLRKKILKIKKHIYDEVILEHNFSVIEYMFPELSKTIGIPK